MENDVSVWREWGTGGFSMSILSWERLIYILPALTFSYTPESFDEDDHSIVYAVVDVTVSFLWFTVAMSYEFSPQE